jgi:hypothetical protein
MDFPLRPVNDIPSERQSLADSRPSGEIQKYNPMKLVSAPCKSDFESDRWKDAGGTGLETCSILTTMPNALTSAVHDRMPVILDPDCYNLWLDPGMTNVAAASDLLKPYDARLMRRYPVSSRVNSVMNGDEACSAPVEFAQIQNRLFL